MIYFTSFYLYFICYISFVYNNIASTVFYTLSLHDALPISFFSGRLLIPLSRGKTAPLAIKATHPFSRIVFRIACRSEEHTSELQSRGHLVCRLLLEKKINC